MGQERASRPSMADQVTLADCGTNTSWRSAVFTREAVRHLCHASQSNLTASWHQDATEGKQERANRHPAVDGHQFRLRLDFFLTWGLHYKNLILSYD